MRTGPRGTDLSYRVLGPLEVRRGDVPVRLVDDRQRRLLARLLLGANRPVLARTIIHELLADAQGPPPFAALWADVSALRGLLTVDGLQAPITSRPGGYVLAVAPEQLDTHRFERLVAEGRALRRNRRTAEAAALLRQALGLWRGDPFCDLPEADLARAEIDRLRELHRQALTERIEADLTLGRTGSLIGEIETLVADDPLSERPRGQLMRALHGAGRPADALEVYRDTDSLLRDNAGVEPGPALQALRTVILHHDETLCPSCGTRVRTPGAGPAAAMPAPAEVPAAAEVPTPAEVPVPAVPEGAPAVSAAGESGLHELVARAAAGQLIGLVAPPGVDRSSVLRAEVLPLLTAVAPSDAARSREILIRPGPTPVASLEQALGGPLVDVLVAMRTDERIVIAVDGLEELLADGVDEAERTRFLDLLVIAASDPARRAIVVVTVGTERYGRFGAHSRFAQRLRDAHHTLEATSPVQPRPAIETGAERTDETRAAAAAAAAPVPPRLALVPAPAEQARGTPEPVPASLVFAPVRPVARRPTAALALSVLLIGLLVLGGAVAMARQHRARRAPPEAQRAQRVEKVRHARPGRISVKQPSLLPEPAPPPGGRATGAASRCIPNGCGD